MAASGHRMDTAAPAAAVVSGWTWLAVIVSFVVSSVHSISFSDNSCQSLVTTPGAPVQYRACLSEPLTVFGPNVTRYTLTVTPPTATCGAFRQLTCTLGIVQTCAFCDNTVPALSHPPMYMTDYNSSINNANLDSYWQSIAWDVAGTVPLANITISFGRLLQLWDDLAITFKSVRPQQMLLEKSMDNGVSWQILQYFNKSCKALWDSGVATTYTTSAPDVVTCSQDYSTEYPSVDGQVVFNVFSRFRLFLGPSSLDYASLYYAFNTTNIIQFLSFTDLRIRLLYPATDGKEGFGGDNFRYYYAISDIRVIAGCWCNLHAKYCAVRGDRTVCQCSHNTMGDNCEQCLPLFNNRPWNPGSYLPYPTGTPNECQPCTCYNHSSSCTYDQSLGFGRCDQCRDFTAGSRCDQCQPGFFQNGSLSLSDPNICTPCSCQVLGVSNNDMTCGMTNGQCNCKPQVMGRQCDLCFDGYYGLLAFAGTCQECRCNTFGTVSQSNVCDKQTGQCPCKAGITSRDCSICRDGFYQFPFIFFSSQDCLSCQCDFGGAFNQVCDKQSGQCPCRPFMTGRRCSLSSDNYYVPMIDMNNIKPKPVTCVTATDLERPEKPFTDLAYVLCNQTNSVTFDPLSRSFQPKLIWSYIPALRYGLNGSLPWSSLTLTIRANGFNSSVNMSQYANDPSAALSPMCTLPAPFTIVMQNLTTGYGNAWVNVNTTFQMDARCVYAATLTADQAGGAAQPLLVDSLVLVPDYHTTAVYANETNPLLLPQYDNCIRRYLALQTRDQTKTDVVCRQFMLSAMTEFSQGALSCNCDTTGSLATICDSVGGQCQCKAGVGGRRCDYCLPGFYNFSVSGCTPCNCDALGSSNPVCNSTSGQCPCRPNVALFGQTTTTSLPSDLQCHLCLSNYYGVTTGQGCQPCNCSPVGSLNSQCAESGQCICQSTIGGNKCDVCLPGYFNFSSAGCVLCNCSTSGSMNITCDNLSGTCYCKTNVQGVKCDQCKSGQFNIDAGNPDGCQPCFCYGHATTCTSAAGFSQLIITDVTTNWQSALDNITYISASSMFLGDMHSAYGQWIMYSAQTRPGIVVTLSNATPPIILEGNGTRIAFRPTNLTVTDSPTQLTFPLHQNFWYYTNLTQPLDAYSFYGVLASLTRILIQQRFGFDFITVTTVSMRTAVASVDGSSQVSFVENCSCTAGQNVAGLSCGNCSQGFRRPTPTSTLYSSCIACLCNGRALTCNEWTGVCLTCANGSIGPQCENCTANVQTPSCAACNPGFWGLSQTGCTACGCVLPMSTSPNCDAGTGQCPCDPTLHVVGRRCDQCDDNYVNTTTGCHACNECYGRVVTQMQILRSNQTNMTNAVNTILSQDQSSTLGPFYLRLIAAQANASVLQDFSNRASNLESTLPTALAALRNALFNLTIIIGTFIVPQTRSITNNIQSAQDNIAACFADMNSTAITLTQAYNQLTNDMPAFSTQLNNLMASLQMILSTISGNSDVIINGIQQLNQTVNSIESNAANASAASQQALQIMQQAKALQDALLTQQIPSLSQMVQSLNQTGQQANTSAYNAFTQAMQLFTNASNLLTNLQLFAMNPVDVPGTTAIIQQQITTANSLNNQTLVAQSSSQKTFNDVQTDNVLTSQLMLQVTANKSSVDALYTRTLSANQTASNALTLAQNTTDQAQRMLQIMTTFDATAQAVQNQANQSLQTVQRIRDLSQQASNASDQILSSLQIAGASSMQAQQLATQAVAEANTLNQALSPVSDKATLLLTQSNGVLNDIQALAADIDQKNNTIVATLNNTLGRYMDATAALEARANLARATADNVTSQIQTIQTTIAGLSARLQSIPQLDINAITQLQTDVQQTHIYYNSLGLPTTIAGLNKTLTDQRVWINAMKNRRDDLKQQIARIMALLAQLRN